MRAIIAIAATPSSSRRSRAPGARRFGPFPIPTDSLHREPGENQAQQALPALAPLPAQHHRQQADARRDSRVHTPAQSPARDATGRPAQEQNRADDPRDVGSRQGVLGGVPPGRIEPQIITSHAARTTPWSVARMTPNTARFAPTKTIRPGPEILKIPAFAYCESGP